MANKQQQPQEKAKIIHSYIMGDLLSLILTWLMLRMRGRLSMSWRGNMNGKWKENSLWKDFNETEKWRKRKECWMG